MTRITIYDVDAEFINELAEENDMTIAEMLEEIIYTYKETME